MQKYQIANFKMFYACNLFLTDKFSFVKEGGVFLYLACT